MRWTRFSTLELFLVAALFALIFGLATASWRVKPRGSYPRPVASVRYVQGLILTTGFVSWAIAWGVVARRHRPPATEFNPPLELKLIWGLTFVGGLVAVVVTVALFVLDGPQFWLGVYYALAVGLVLMISGASQATDSLRQVVLLQTASLLACDPVNFLLGLMALHLLRRPHVQGYLNHVEQSSTATPTLTR